MTYARDPTRTPDPAISDAAGQPGGDTTAPGTGLAEPAAVPPESGVPEPGALQAAVPPRPTSPAVTAARARDAAITDSILRLVAGRGPSGSICPSEAAREVAQAEGRADWHLLMGNVRRVAGRLQAEGRVEILRKGRPAPADVRGVIRLRQAHAGTAHGSAAQKAGDAAADPAGAV